MDSLEKYYLLGIAIAAMAGVPDLSEAASGHFFTHGDGTGSKTMAFASRPGSRSFQTAPRIHSQGTVLHDAWQQRQSAESQADSRPGNPSAIVPAG